MSVNTQRRLRATVRALHSRPATGVMVPMPCAGARWPFDDVHGNGALRLALAGVLAERIGAPETVAAGGAVCVVAALIFRARLPGLRPEARRMIHADEMVPGHPTQEMDGRLVPFQPVLPLASPLREKVGTALAASSESPAVK